jgi:acyl-coenzyme A synthetase/AMP-(fatty) acid ligase
MKVVITATTVRRGGRKIPLKPVMDQALLRCPFVERVFVLRRDGDGDGAFVEGRYLIVTVISFSFPTARSFPCSINSTWLFVL